MKSLYLTITLTLFTIFVSAQVGINTTNPTASLDVNGSLRVRQFISPLDAEFLLGLDEDGNLVRVYMGEDVQLDGTVIKSTSTFSEVATNIPDLSTLIGGNGGVNNLNILILPGASNNRKSIFPLPNGSNTSEIDITGIAGGTLGRRIWLYPTSGKLKLVPDSTDSLPGNRIRDNKQLKVQQYSMIELFYDGTHWVIMSNHD